MSSKSSASEAIASISYEEPSCKNTQLLSKSLLILWYKAEISFRGPPIGISKCFVSKNYSRLAEPELG